MFYDKNYRTAGELAVQGLGEINDLTQEATEMGQAQKMYAYYKNSRIDILAYLGIHMEAVFGKAQLANMVYDWVNEVPRIVRRLSLTYKGNAERKIDKSEEATKKYHEKQPYLHSSRKELNRLTKLFNTVLVRPIWDEKRQILNHQFLTRAHCWVVESDGVLEQVTYCIEDEKNPTEAVYIHWTESDHWASSDLEGKKVINRADITGNPYGRIPYVYAQLETAPNFWGDGLSSLVDDQETINGLRTDLANNMYFSFGQPIGTNLGIKKGEFILGPKFPLLRDKVTNDELPPDLKFASPDNRMQEKWNIIKGKQDELGTLFGLPSSGVTYSSGRDRETDHWELLEINKDDQAIFREFERELFELENVVLEKDARFTWGKTLDITFAEVEFPKTEQEQETERNWNLEHNTDSIVDICMEEHGIDDRNKAIELLERNKKENKLYLPQSNNANTTLLDNLIQ